MKKTAPVYALLSTVKLANRANTRMERKSKLNDVSLR